MHCDLERACIHIVRQVSQTKGCLRVRSEQLHKPFQHADVNEISDSTASRSQHQ